MATQYVLRVADCTNFCYDRVNTVGKALRVYGDAAAIGFTNCRFVAFGLEHLLVGYDEDHWVLTVSGNQVLTVELGQFGDRPPNLRGYLVIANCTYYEEFYDLVLGKGGGTGCDSEVPPNYIYVDQYLCGADGKPAKKNVVFKNYFLDGNTYVEPGRTFLKVWDVERKHGDLTLDGILSIKYLRDIPHKLRNCAVQHVAEAVTEVNDFPQSVRFIHAFVACPCGKSAYTVGSWNGFRTICCGIMVKSPISIKFSGDAGSLFVLPKGTKPLLGKDIKTYAGATFKFCCDFGSVEVWCLLRAFAVNGFCTVGAHLITADDPVLGSLYQTNCILGDDGYSCDYDLCYSIIAGSANDGLARRVLSGTLNAAACLFDNAVAIFKSIKIWFVETCGPIFSNAVKYLWDALTSVGCSLKDLVKFFEHLNMARIYVENYVLRFSVTTLAKFKNVVTRFLEILRISFNILCVEAGERYFKCKDITGTQLKLFKNRIVGWSEHAITGVKEAGLTTARYFSSIGSSVKSVCVSRTEEASVAIEQVTDEVIPPANGICRIIEKFAFYYGGGYYFPLTSSNEVIDGVVFKAAGSPLSNDDEHDVEKPPIVKLEFEFDDGQVLSFLKKSIGNKCKGFSNFDDFEEYIQNKLEQLRVAVSEAGFDFQIPDCYIYSSSGSYEMEDVMRISEFSCEDDAIMEELVSEAECVSNTIASDVLYLGSSKFWRDHWELDCRPLQKFVFADQPFWMPESNGWNEPLRAAALVVGKMFAMAGSKLEWSDKEFVELWNIKSQFLWYKIAAIACPDGDLCFETIFKVVISKLSLHDSFAEWVCECGATARVEGIDACMGDFANMDCLCGKFLSVKALDIPFQFYDSVVPDIRASCVIGCNGNIALSLSGVVISSYDCNSYVVIKNGFVVDEADVSFDVILQYDVDVSIAKGSLQDLHAKYQYVILAGDIAKVEGTNYYNIPRFGAIGALKRSLEVIPIGSEILVGDVGISGKQLANVFATKACSYVMAFDSDVTSYVTKRSIAFPLTPLVTYGGVKHLKLQHNNCWANAVFVGLQLCGYYDADELNWQCALSGANSRFIGDIYKANNVSYGFMADAAQALERFLANDSRMVVKLQLSCFCSVRSLELRGSVFKFRPVNGYFDYGRCNVCDTTIQAIIWSIDGRGFFCYTATKDNKLLFPGCRAEVFFTGPDNAGHYYIKYGGKYYDGTGCHKVTNARSQIAIYNCSGYPEPLYIKNGIRFFRASLDDMLHFKPVCVVNAANSNLAHSGGIAMAINARTNGQLQALSDKCKNKPKVGCSNVIKCDAFNVINAVGPKNTDEDVGKLLGSAYSSIRKQGHGLVIMPLLSVGIFKVPLELSLKKFVDAFDGFSNFYCFVYTDAEACKLLSCFIDEPQFDPESLQSANAVDCKEVLLEETVSSKKEVSTDRTSVEDVPTLVDIDSCISFGVDEILAECSDDVVTVLVSEDSVNYVEKTVSTVTTFGNQLGVCAINNDVVTDVVPSALNNGALVDCVPIIDYLAYYGFDAANFVACGHDAYNCKYTLHDGVVTLQQSNNNCWLNVVCLALQQLKPIFRHDGVKKLWDDYCVGNVAGFCHFVYQISDIKLGCKGDAEVVLRKLSAYIESDNEVVTLTCTQCVHCKDKECSFKGAVVMSHLSRNSVVSGKCEHGYCNNVVTKSVSGNCILTNPKPGKCKNYITHIGRILYNGDISNGHYTFYDCVNGLHYDGTSVNHKSLFDVDDNVSSIVVAKQYQTAVPKVVDPVKQESNFMAKFDVFSAKFFKVGDFIFAQSLVLLLLCFHIFKSFFKFCKKRDLSVLAHIPKRSGIVITKSFVYNGKAAVKTIYSKRQWLYLFGIIGGLLYITHGFLFIFMRFTSLCNGWIDGYSNSSFIKSEYCNGSIACYECLRGYEELADFPHTKVQWSFTYNLSEFFVCYHLFAFAIMWCFGNKYVKVCLFYFVLQLWNGVMCWFDKSEPMWLLNVVKFDIVSMHAFSLFCMYKIVWFFKHVIFGCTDPRCLSCSRSAKYDRVSCETIVNGVKRGFYVKANGGKKFCEKHQFFCYNCDTYGVGNTFINEQVAKEVSNVTRTSVRATGPSYIEIDKVTFEDGFYYLYAGDQFWRYEFDVTSKKFDAESCIKDLSLSADFIVYNESGTARANAFNSCVYFSQLLCKPIKVVNKTLLSTLNVDHGSAMHEAYCKVLYNSFNKDFSKCVDLQSCKKLACIDCRDNTFEAGVKLAHKFDVLLCNDSANNFVTTYAKAITKVGTADLAVFNRESVREVNHAVLTKNKVTVVWNVSTFSKLSSETQDYVIKTTKAKGLLFLLTFNEHVNTQNLPCTAVGFKNGGFPVRFFSLFKAFIYVMAACCLCYAITYFTSINFKPAVFDSVPEYDFRYMESGAMKFFSKGLPCVYNLYKDFPEWHKQRFGFIPSFSSNCPIVIGANDINTNVVPNVASNVMLSGRILVFTYQTVFGHNKWCFNDAYNINMAKIAASDCEKAAIFPSACTTLEGVGGKQVYCYNTGFYNGARLYSDIMPHLRYYSDTNNYIMLPEVIMRGFGFKVTRFLNDVYCRIGECASSKAGICVGADEWYVYDKEVGANYFCSNDFKGLVWAFLSIFNANIGTVLLTGQLTFNAIIAFVIVAICYTFVKFKRLFGDMSTFVLMVLAATLVNSLSYLFTINFVFLMCYTVIYFISTRKVCFSMVWDLMYVVAYIFVAPWYVIVGYCIILVCDCMPSLTKLKLSTNLLEGDKFVGSFEHAAKGTFVLNAQSCAKLVNEVGQEKLDRYAASYGRYRHYSGNPNEADYRSACFAWLAKAIKDYQLNPQDKLYCAPTVSYNSVLQSGFRKIAQPSGLVEPCVVRVCYSNSYLNGIWLGDQVYAPRHVIASDVTRVVDYDTEQNLARSCNFSISRGNTFLTVKSFKFEGCNVVINVAEVNPFTPEYKFATLKPGDNFNILACYDGVPSGVYGVTLRHNNTIKGSFVNGTCGSPGYNIVNGVIHFCYLHQMELGSGSHVGSDFSGKMYGGYLDQCKVQVEGVNKLITENVIAFFYAALLNGERWWCSRDNVCVTNFNAWAADNNFTLITATDVFNLVASKTGVSVEQILAAIISYSKGFGHRTLLGYASINDEYTITEVMQQMFGVQLQSGKVKKAFECFILFFFFVGLFWAQFLMYTSISILKWEVIIATLAGLTCLSAMSIVFIKHKMVFLYGFIIPATFVVVFSNFLWDYVVSAIITEHFSFMATYFSFDVQSAFNLFVLGFVLLLHLARFYCSGGALITCLVSCAYTVGLFVYFVQIDVLSAFFMFISSIQCSWAITWFSFKLATFLIGYVPSYYVVIFGYTKVLMAIYMTMGYLFCAYYGVLFWVNKFTMSNFSLCLGYYDFKVSQAEFKYMVANNLKCPTNPMEALYLNIKLMGIGGQKVIKLSTLQSKLTDLKCTNVVLLSCLSSMNVAVNSKEWSYCVQLHNDINLCDDPEKATEKLLALCSFFLSKQQNFNLDALIDSYFANKSILHSVASTFASMPSYIAYEKAKLDYEQAKQNGTSDQVLRQLLKAMNIAKSEFDLEASVQRKLSRMADNAAAQMFKDARNVDRKAKVVSSMHGLLVGMLRKLDMSSITELMDLAKDGILPLSVIPAASSNRLIVVTPSLEAFDKIRYDNSICYAGSVWTITSIKDVDGSTVNLKEVCSSSDLSWPLHVEAERVVKLQNNEITPSRLCQRVVNTDNGTGKALYCNEQGRGFVYALLSDNPDITHIKWDNGLGEDMIIELEKPVKFAIQSPSGVQVKYLYFVKNLNTLRRGAVLGFIGATVRLQVGKPTEFATDCQLLTLCAFAVDPKDAYLTAVKQGYKPLGNCIKMINNGSGNGLAITPRVEANTMQDSYGGASCCIYCRASVEHPGMNGVCNLRGKYVQVPQGTTDPIRFILENDVCSVCSCWLGNGCICDRSAIQSTTIDKEYLNGCGALVMLN